MAQQAQVFDIKPEMEVKLDKDPSIKQKIVIKKIPNLTEEWEEIHKKHLIESLQAYQYLNDLTPPEKPMILLNSDVFTKPDNRKLLVFDMDETLIHCKTDANENTVTDIKIPINYEDRLEYKYVNIRPYVIECLLELSKLYYIIVFTASTKDYADPILNYLEKDHKLIQNRFYRHHCHRTKDKVSIKDLRIFEQCGYDLKDIILVDNATH